MGRGTRRCPMRNRTALQPISTRTLAMGLTDHLGRSLSVAALVTIGVMAQRYGWSSAFRRVLHCGSTGSGCP